MVTVYEDRFFHLRGRHVQHAHGKNSTRGGEHLSGAMIALMPTEKDATRLRLSGGESADQLHLTLFFLGEGSDWSSEDRQSLTDDLLSALESNPVDIIKARAFGVSHWNGDLDNPCWVLSVGDVKEEDYSLSLDEVRGVIKKSLSAELPIQYTPWAPHICIAYTDDVSLTKELQKKLGEVSFDRIRVAFAGEYTDIVLGGSLTAAAPPLRRNLSAYELSSRVDFVRMQSQWESAVDEVLADVRPIREAQREQITEAVFNAAEVDNLDALTAITVDDEALYAVLLEHMTRVANQSGLDQQREAEEQGVDVPEWSLENLTAAVGLDLLRSIARVTARVINTSFVQSGVRRALSLIGRPAVSPEQVAQEVDTHLNELSDASLRDSIGGAVTSAQNEGRRTVLAVAPEASEYVSSEVLDRNVCGPCRNVDGTVFETLADAQQAYPSGGYRDCLGGVRCRGTIVAVWE